MTSNIKRKIDKEHKHRRKRKILFGKSIVRSCNHYTLFVIIAQILQNLAFPLFMAIIKTQNQC